MDESVEEVVDDNQLNFKEELKQPEFQTKNRKGKVVNIHQSTYVKVVVYQALTYDDTQNIVNNLKIESL